MIRATVATLALMLLAPACSIPGVREAEEPPPRPSPGGTLTVAITEPDSLDPSRASNRSALAVMKVMCDTLVAYHPRSGELAPGLAASWTVAPDARSVTLKLSDAKFQNGRKVTAQDVVYSVSRFAHPKTGSPEFFLFDRLAGYSELRAETSQVLSGVKAIDEGTVQFDLTEPFAELPAVLAHPAAGAVIPKEEVDKGAEAFASKPVCTGPYTLSEPYVKGTKAALIRSGERSQKSTVFSRDGSGYFNNIVFRVVANQGDGYELVRKGEVQLAEVPIPRLDEARDSKATVVSGTNGHLAYIGFPVSKPPFDNASVRKALALDIDRTHIIERLLAGTRRLPRGFMPPATGELSSVACPATIKPRSDVPGARGHLRASGLDPATIKPLVRLNASGGHEKWLQPVIDRWGADLGVTATMKSDEWKTYLDLLVDPGAEGPFRLAWAIRYPSPEAFLGPLFSPGSPDNFTRYAAQPFQKALTDARATPANDARADLYRQALEVLCQDMPIVPMWFGQSHFAASEKLAARSVRLDVFGDPVLREMGYPRG